MLLHCLSAGPDSLTFRDCLRMRGDDDALLLMGDAVYAALAGSESLNTLNVASGLVFVLMPDAQARGVDSRLSDGIAAIGMAEFVALSERYSAQQAWF